MNSTQVFAGDRVHEFAMKLAGATYLEVGEWEHFHLDLHHKKAGPSSRWRNPFYSGKDTRSQCRNAFT
jgi:hypothetical protein